MTPHISREELANEISTLNENTLDTRQVLSRLKKLLPDRLKKIEKAYKNKFTPGRAKRKALLDRDYVNYLHEILRLSSLVSDNYLKRDKNYRHLNAKRYK